MEQKNLCSVGLLGFGNCNTKNEDNNTFKSLDELSRSDIKCLLLRLGVTESNLRDVSTECKICKYHENFMLKWYGRNQNKCCNPFKLHKRKCLAVRYELTVSDVMALKCILGSDCKPGQKLCQKCSENLKLKLCSPTRDQKKKHILSTQVISRTMF